MWKKKIREKLSAIFPKTENDPDPFKITRIFWYLDTQDAPFERSQVSQAWSTLKGALEECHRTRSDKIFRDYVETLIEDTRESRTNAAFVRAFHSERAIVSNSVYEAERHRQMTLFGKHWKLESVVSTAVGAVWSWFKGAAVPGSPQNRALMSMIKTLFTSADEVAVKVTSNGWTGFGVMLGVSAVWLGVSAAKNLSQWKAGKISGKRCAKNIIDTTFAIGGSMLGSVVGAAVGTFFLGPAAGTLVGGIAGGLAFSRIASMIGDRLTQMWFDIPFDDALEKAYAFMGIRPSASNHELNMAFRRLLLQHHPDKGGDPADFITLKMHMELIKVKRGKDSFDLFSTVTNYFKDLFSKFTSSSGPPLLAIEDRH